MKQQRFAPAGRCALDPKAFGMLFMMAEAPATEARDGVSIVSVRGPLMHHQELFFDSYDAIKSRVMEALEAKPQAIVLSLDSPGGLVSGCFDTAREIKAACAAAGVPLYAYVDGCATSAAYALACASDWIVIPQTGIVGSIGVIDALAEQTALDAAMGLKFQLISSGARKQDGNPHTPITDGAIAAATKQVEYLAGIFFSHVAESRGVSAESVRALEAGMMAGTDAVSAKLADTVATFDEMLAMIASGAVPTKEQDTMATTAKKADSSYEDAIAALRSLAEGEDENAKAAKKMLKIVDGDGEEDKPAAETTEDKPAAEAPPPAPEKKDEDAKAIAMRAEAMALATRADIEAGKVEAERTRLLASRPDFAPEFLATLEKPTTPIAMVRDFVKNMPRGVARNPAAAASVTPTRGEGQGAGTASRLPANEKLALDQKMGLAAMAPGVVEQGNRLILGASVPVASGKGE